MVFNSAAFLFMFLPAAFLLYRVIPGKTGKNILLALASLVFYAFGGLSQLPVLLFAAVWNYIFGLLLRKEDGHRRLWMAVAVIGDLALLCICKYLAFLLPGLPIPQFALPLGISFYTFHGISYIVDCYRDRENVSRSPLQLFLYLAFFPRLLAGPIVQYHEAGTAPDGHPVSAEDTAAGLRRFVRGMAKKLLIAEGVGAIANAVYALPPAALGSSLAWLGALSYSLQIFFDFSGYSDMAIGLGRLFGFRFPENFDYPYTSCTLSEFWRRWHMTLNRWFTDYLYIPLGGSRRGKVRTVFNKLIVFLATGLWHGAGWTFLLWGLWHGVFVSAEGLCRDFLEKLRRRSGGRVLLRIYTLLVVVTGFVMFRADSLSQGFRILGRMFSFTAAQDPNAALYVLTPARWLAFALGIVFSLPVVPALRSRAAAVSPAAEKTAEIAENVLALLGLILCVLAMAGGGFSPFIYQQF